MNKVQHIQDVIAAIKTDGKSAFEIDQQALFDAEVSNQRESSGVAIWLLTIAGGFLAALAFLSFVTMAGLNKSAMGMTATGLLLIAVSLLIKRFYRKLLTDTFSITFFGLGCILFGVGLSKYGLDHNGIAAALILIALLALILVQDFVFSLVSLLIIHGCILSLFFNNKLYDGIYLYIVLLAFALYYYCLLEANLLRAQPIFSRLYVSGRLAILLAFLSTLCIAGIKEIIPVKSGFFWVASLGSGVVIVMMVSKIIDVMKIVKLSEKIAVFVLSGLIIAAALGAPAIMGALLAVLICFFVNFQAGLLISLLTLVYCVAQYFYDINLSMPQKSAVLFFTGLFFIFIYMLTFKYRRENEKI